MVDFEYFILKGDVKKQQKDETLSRALIRESLDRLKFVKSLGVNETNAKYIVENSYDVLRELIESKLALEGFKSYSHEATIIFLKRFPNFKESEIKTMDNLRKIRHGIKYYGKNVDANKAKEILDFTNYFLQKLKSLIQ